MRSAEPAAVDRRGQPVVAGARVRILRDPPLEGEVRRVIPHYGVLTVIVDGAKAGKTERMVRVQEVELVGASTGA